jgi:hypothetical protein
VRLTCGFGPAELGAVVPCLDAVSKDVEGVMLLLAAEEEECRKLDCKSLTTRHAVRARLRAHDCDGDLGGRLDGALVLDRLTTVFEDADPAGRGVHAGDFRWFNRGLVITGQLHGITNAGILRRPLERACEECRQPNVMIGRLCGTVGRAFIAPGLEGALLTAIYRFEADLRPVDEPVPLVGTIEGAVIQVCPREDECLDFAVLQDGANPRVEQGHRIEVSDLNGPRPSTEIRTWGAITGLHLWHHTVIELAAPTDEVRLTIGRFATAGTVTAFDGGGTQLTQVPITGPQNVPIEVVVAATGIARLEIDCPQDEHLLVKLCTRDARQEDR